MKDPINMFHATIGPWITNLKFQRMFINGWGTKYIDGIHVFNNERLVYPRWAMDSDSRLVRLLKHMKAYDSLVSAGNQAEGIDYIFVTLNKSKITKGSILSDQLISERIEDLFEYNKEYTMNLNMDMPAGITAATPKEQILSYLSSNWLTILNDKNFNIQSNNAEENSSFDGYYQLVLFDLLNTGEGERDFSINIEDVKLSFRTEYVSNEDDESYYFLSKRIPIIINTLNLKIKFNRIGSIHIDSAIIDAIKNPKRTIRTEYKDENGNIQSDVSYEYFRAASAASDLFYRGHLRVGILDKDYIGFNNRLFTNLIQSMIDTRYVEKKVEWWKKALVIIAAIVIVVVTWGWGAPIALSLGSLALGLMSMYFAKNGEPGVAKYAAKGSRAVGYAAMAAGITQIIQQGFKAWVGNTWTSMAGAGLQVLNMVAPMYYKNQMENIQDDINAIAGENEKLERAKIVMEDNDIPLAKTLTNEQMNPLNTLEGPYDFDSAYEPTGKWKDNFYEGGCNICATHHMPTIKTDNT